MTKRLVIVQADSGTFMGGERRDKSLAIWFCFLSNFYVMFLLLHTVHNINVCKMLVGNWSHSKIFWSQVGTEGWPLTTLSDLYNIGKMGLAGAGL